MKNALPIPVTINDCILLWQMGFVVEINNGSVAKIRRERRK